MRQPDEVVWDAGRSPRLESHPGHHGVTLTTLEASTSPDLNLLGTRQGRRKRDTSTAVPSLHPDPRPRCPRLVISLVGEPPRAGQVLAAYAELDALTADIPAGPTETRLSEPEREAHTGR